MPASNGEHKAEERQLKAQLGAVRWRDLNEQVGQRERVIGDQEIAFEALVAEQRASSWRGSSPSSIRPR